MKLGQDSSKLTTVELRRSMAWHGEHQINLKQVLPASAFRLTAVFMDPPFDSSFSFLCKRRESQPRKRFTKKIRRKYNTSDN
jgi:cbb3-type cytochrome oxidase cytochrome c subunit